MFALSKLLVISTLALSAVSLATPHAARSAHHHAALAARNAVPEPAPVAQPDVKVVRRKALGRRSDGGKCRVRTSTSSSASSTSSSSSAAPTSSSNADVPAAVEAAPSSSKAPAPTSSSKTSSSTQKASSTSSASPAASGNLPSFLVGTQTGQGTFYAIGLGACGITNSGDDRIAAVSHLLFDGFPGAGANPNNNPVCGRKVTASYQGKSTTVTITDRCTGCALTDLDFSPRAFQDLADESIGRLFGLTWHWD